MFFPLYIANVYIGYWIIEGGLPHEFDNLDTTINTNEINNTNNMDSTNDINDFENDDDMFLGGTSINNSEVGNNNINQDNDFDGFEEFDSPTITQENTADDDFAEDIQKELEAKFDELFGPMEDDE